MKGKISDIGQMLQNRRKSIGLTQAQLGARLGVNKSEISKIENGRGLSVATISKVSDALGVTPRISLQDTKAVTPNAIFFIMSAISKFATAKGLALKEACNYLVRFRGIEFIELHYEAQHQLSLEETVDDLTAICLKHGGTIV